MHRAVNVIIFRRYERFYNDEEYGKMEIFIKDENKTLEEYENAIKYYHDFMTNIPIKIKRTAFSGLFEVSRKIFIETIIENVGRIKGLLTDKLVNNYQNTAKK